MVNLWIDSLNDAERDRIITHPDPTYDGQTWWDYRRACGCIVGCVIGKKILDFGTPLSAPFSLIVGQRFPKLTARFGAPRIWRVCKARAAKRNRVYVSGAPWVAVAVGAP